jgi:hypothetical protein
MAKDNEPNEDSTDLELIARGMQAMSELPRTWWSGTRRPSPAFAAQPRPAHRH